ncbi:phosphorylcholine phosphatase [Purpureocillium lavendulum]|uniref:phosphoserine phosphatase n=1 Tax=Purpureocillium lavendulum TaxID=1247861 RepID=A0AB34FQC5_9HYPO|nr:phosphorylcholine phosphatase [Purpureocillium lavendulum]
MRSLTLRTAAALAVTLAGPLVDAAPAPAQGGQHQQKCTAGPALKHWPPEAAKALNAMIARNAHNGSYAVFDMDNTSYQFDLEESLLPFLENKGVITRDAMDPSLRIVPFKDTPSHNESIYSYYNRLCDIEDAVCYPFAAQIFSGIPLRDLKGYVDELMALNGTVPTTMFDGEDVVKVDVSPPKVFRGQVELYNKLMNNGIDVYVVSAASEELVRMVASDPKYGYNSSGAVTSARKQIADGDYNEQANLDLVMTPFLWTPATWKTGKWAAILSYIDEWKRPVLAGGDTPDSDGPMIFHGVDVERGGIHLWVNRKDKYMKQIDDMRTKFAADQKREGVPVTADKNWVVVTPKDIL